MPVPLVLHMWETTPAEKWSAGSLTITLRFLVDECGSAKMGLTIMRLQPGVRSEMANDPACPAGKPEVGWNALATALHRATQRGSNPRT